MTKRMSFGAELERLEAIVRNLEDSEVDLDEALKLFQEGVKRLKNARKLLQDTELTVKKVIDAADGSLPDDDVDD
ncbi:MAG: exodeoxyribonuclease VII small subunit [Gemmatimonadetes bacterium]|nr:exodeoxyribonuclease VII small subunit [Gemmatimonadota bacterium]MCH8935753.1 exodeoxyribonuclease VII small subunit [Gemmatimonadota bacterium]